MNNARAPRWTLAALTAAAVTAAAHAQTPRYDAETFYDTEAIAGASFSPDEEKILFSSDRTGVFNVFSIPVAGGEPTQLTFSNDNAVFAIGYFPYDERFLFTSDTGGNELNHVFVRELDGSIKDLTPGDSLKAAFFGWSGDLKSFYIQTNERDPQFFDVYRYDAKSYERELVYQNDEGHSVGDISRDGKWLVVSKTRTNADNDLYLVDIFTKERTVTHLTPHEGDISYSSLTFSPLSNKFYFASNEGSEFDRVYIHDIKTGASRVEIEDDWDVMYVSFSWDGRWRAHATNADARTAITIIETKTATPIALPTLPAGDITGVSFARSGDRMAFYVNGDTSPSNLHVMDMRTGEFRRLTDSLSKKVDEAHLVNSEVIRYPSSDGLPIPALLYRPKDATAENPAPAMLWVHGGPGGQSRTGYNPVIQHLVNHGYAIISVNNRGSSGYGKSFYHMDDKRHGEVDLMDCVSARTYLETLDWVDNDRIGIMGGSYGGYMVCAALAFEPEVFDVGVNIFGVTNWIRTLESIPPWWAAFRESLYAELGDPETDRERLHRISPLFHAQNIVKPFMVIQGANDPRVLQVESDEIVEAVKANGVPVEYIVFPDEGHGFRSKANRITASEAYVSFLDRYLRGD